MVISIYNLNLLGLFSKPEERGKRNAENKIIDWDSRMKKWHSKFNRLYQTSYWFDWDRIIGLIGTEKFCPMIVEINSNSIDWQTLESKNYLGMHN